MIPLILVDRSRSVQDWTCPRSRYLGYEYMGRGIRKSSTNLPLFTGTVIHDGLAAIAFFTQDKVEVPINDIASAAFTQMRDQLLEASKDKSEQETLDFANEQAALTEGLLRGFYKHVWPNLMSRYPVVAYVEKEVEYTLDGITFMAKPDLLLEDYEGSLHYIEYKSTSSKKPEWINSWETAVQLHSSIKAVEQTIGKIPTDVTIVGLYKGYISYGKQSSPFAYAYKKLGNPPFSQDLVQYDWKAGFKRYPTWELSGGVAKWVDDMPANILADQFPMTAPIFINESLVERFFKQRALREHEIARCMSSIPSEEDLDRVFPQHFDKCQPAFGWSCEYKKICHGNVSNPLEEGFELRQPHHQREMEIFNSAEN